jgi:hypothetical protein
MASGKCLVNEVLNMFNSSKRQMQKWKLYLRISPLTDFFDTKTNQDSNFPAA